MPTDPRLCLDLVACRRQQSFDSSEAEWLKLVLRRRILHSGYYLLRTSRSWIFLSFWIIIIGPIFPLNLIYISTSYVFSDKFINVFISSVLEYWLSLLGSSKKVDTFTHTPHIWECHFGDFPHKRHLDLFLSWDITPLFWPWLIQKTKLSLWIFTFYLSNITLFSKYMFAKLLLLVANYFLFYFYF